MNDETLARALGSLRGVRMSEMGSDRVRDELEKAWRDRARSPRRGFSFATFARALVPAALVVSLAFVTLRSSADSPLYAFRIVIEDALVAVQADAVAYVTTLYDERLEEAARFEAVGNALAASRAHDATSDALRLLDRVSPKPSDNSPEPTPQSSTAIFVPTPSPYPVAEASPTASPEASAHPSVQPTTATTSKPPTPKPTATPTPRPTTTTPRPSPTPTAPAMQVTAYGDVLYADGARVDGACVSMTYFGQNCVAGTVNGRVYIQLEAKKGQTITVYVENYDAARGGILKGKVTVTVTGQYVQLGTITLR